MFETNIATIKRCYTEFKGTGMYIVLFLVALIYIYLKEDNKKVKLFFVYNSILMVFITLNPIFNKLVGRIFTASTYWRTFWMIPFGITISYAAVKVIMEREGKIERIVITLGIITTIMISGKFIYTIDNYAKVGNLYILPDEDVLAIQLIVAESGYKKAIVPPGLVAHVRQIDASINLAYQRVPTFYYANHPIVSDLTAGNVPKVIQIAKEKNCNYIVFEKSTVLSEPMENYNFYKLNETQNYVIYKTN